MQNDQAKLVKVGIGFIIVILLGAAIWKLGVFESDVSKSPLVITPQQVSMGEISMAKGNVSTVMMLKNEGDDDIKLTDVRTSCMCTTATIDGITFGMHQNPVARIVIPAGQTKEMTVVFDPNAHGPDATGPIDRVISIRTNSEVTPQIEGRLSGNVVK